MSSNFIFRHCITDFFLPSVNMFMFDKNKTTFAWHSVMHISTLFYLLQLVFSTCVAAETCRLVQNHWIVIIFWSSGIIDCLLFTFKEWFLFLCNSCSLNANKRDGKSIKYILFYFVGSKKTFTVEKKRFTRAFARMVCTKKWGWLEKLWSWKKASKSWKQSKRHSQRTI